MIEEGMPRRCKEKPDEAAESLRGPVALCRLFLQERVNPGDRVIDATCGNGNDTIFLAGLVGNSGKVLAFDIDGDALEIARAKIREASLESVVDLLQAGHERLGEFVKEPVRAVVFNLGYLPGGSRDSVTVPATTLAALEQARNLLSSGGVIVLSVYTGHPGGAEEGRAVDQWLSGLPSPRFNVWRCSLLNRREDAPYLLLVEKTA